MYPSECVLGTDNSAVWMCETVESSLNLISTDLCK